jgi:hypothetical protein
MTLDARLQSGWSHAAYWGLESVVLKRLEQYNGVKGISEERRAATRMFDILGRRMGPKMRTLSHLPSRYAKPYIAFPELTERLTRDPRVQSALSRIATDLAAAHQTGAPYNLFAAIEEASGSRDAAMEWMAVLFQDLPGGGEYFKTLEPESLKRDLTQILNVVGAPRRGWRLNAFPPSVHSEDARLYHFYVPAYLSLRLVQSGIDPQAAVAVTFALESEYQGFKARAAHASPGHVLLNMLGTGARDSDFFEQPHFVDALYLGYAGSRLGAGLPIPLMGEADFAAQAETHARALFADVTRGQA